MPWSFMVARVREPSAVSTMFLKLATSVASFSTLSRWFQTTSMPALGIGNGMPP
ncbi:hypothetical protein D3C76_1615490 [compost metagenome]